MAHRLRGRVRAIVPDRPGYGRGGGRAVGFRANAAAVVELLDRLQVESAVVAGHSWGAGAALALAIDHPRRVRGLILIGALSPAVPPGLLDRAFANPLLGPPATRLGFLVAGLVLSVPPGRRLVRAAAPAVDPEHLERTARAWRTGAVWRSFFDEQRALVEELPTLASGLARVQAPATIVSGGRDRVSPPSHARALARALPAATVVTIERAGHLLPQRHPGRVAEAIARAAGAPGSHP